MPDGSRGFEVESRVGTTFGKYTVLSLLGKGGMGEVYEAYDTDKGRTVALKILADRFSNDPTFRARFQRESHAAAVLQEPHVIPIHDWGEVDGRLYIDMRLVRGRTLDEVIAQGPLVPARAVAIIAQIGAALDAAHAEGLMHRDIKPHNIIVTDADFAYLVDFGIAETQGDTRLTTDGTPVGTVHYMAPERFTAQGATPAVDVYALACVLYESLTGESPFALDSLENIVGAHLASPPPRPSAANSRVPAAFDSVIARGMAKNPDDRYGTAGGLVRAAERVVDPGSAGGSGATRGVDSAGRSAATRGVDSAGRSAATRGVDKATLGLPADSALPASIAPAETGRRGRNWLVPTVIAVAAALILGAVGVVIGLLVRQQPTPPQATPSMPSSTDRPSTNEDKLFRGYILKQPSVEVRPESTLSAPVSGYLPHQSEVFIVCTSIGDVVEGPGAGGGPPISTPVWDKVRTTRDGADLGFVPDAWVKTGTAEPQAGTC